MVSKIQPLDRLSTPAVIPWATAGPPPVLQPLAQVLPPNTRAPFSFSGRYGMHTGCMQQTDVMCFAHMMMKPQQCFIPGYASSTCALTKPEPQTRGAQRQACWPQRRPLQPWVQMRSIMAGATTAAAAACTHQQEGHTAPHRSASAHACAAIAVRHAAASIKQDTADALQQCKHALLPLLHPKCL